MHAEIMIASHPQVRGGVDVALIRAVEACYDCAQTCTACADACLGEDAVADLVQCIRTDLDCADICAATGRIASRRTGTNTPVVRAMLAACAEACDLCADECDGHAGMHEHCRICRDACRTCAEACRAAAEGMAPRVVI